MLKDSHMGEWDLREGKRVWLFASFLVQRPYYFMLRMFLPNHLGLVYTGGLYCNATIRAEFDFPQKSRIFSFYM